MPIGTHAAVVEYRADLPEIAWIFGLKGLGSTSAPCYVCEAHRDELYEYETFNMSAFEESERNIDQMRREEFEKCSIYIEVANQADLDLLLRNLFFDKRQDLDSPLIVFTTARSTK